MCDRKGYTVLWRSFCKDSTIHSLNFLVMKMNYSHRIFWIVFNIFTISSTVAFMVHMWEDYLETPTIVTQSSSNIPIQNVYFPALAVCNMNKISKKKAVEYAQEINSYRKLENIDSILQDLVSLGQLYTSTSESEGSFIRLQKWMDKYDNYTEDYDISRRLLQLSPSCEDMLQSCRWADEQQDCSKLFSTRITYDGFCCTFNYVRQFTNSKIYSNSGQKIEPGSEEPRKPIGAGMMNGLSLALKNDLDDYFFTTLETTGVQGVDIQCCRLSRQNKRFPERIIIGFNQEVLIGLQVDLCRGSSSLAQLPLSLRRCMFRADGRTSFGPYSHSDCLVDCKTKSIVSLCQCIPFTVPVESEDVSACSLIDLPCLGRYTGNGLSITQKIWKMRNCWCKNNTTRYLANIAYHHVAILCINRSQALQTY
ncbi:unnamed protein product [Acanthoscelides obtectus]|uniref:Sodium channel protein Nach n=1 Tax=Acanthoscelides obtectus TaxID=200917 RepID=A0A9P0LPP6_ACAOB|nr:unnamed protein product [Acanthoscelides obtectus]CAK1659289.1 Sodium channel protein Nach [Acanthoscelides obtectus]